MSTSDVKKKKKVSNGWKMWISERASSYMQGGRKSLSGKLPLEEGQKKLRKWDFRSWLLLQVSAADRKTSGKPWKENALLLSKLARDCTSLERSKAGRRIFLRKESVNQWDLLSDKWNRNLAKVGGLLWADLGCYGRHLVEIWLDRIEVGNQLEAL